MNNCCENGLYGNPHECEKQPFIEKQVDFETAFRNKWDGGNVGCCGHALSTKAMGEILADIKAHTQHLKAQLVESLPKEKEVPEYKKRREFDCALGFNSCLHATKEIINQVLK